MKKYIAYMMMVSVLSLNASQKKAKIKVGRVAPQNSPRTCGTPPRQVRGSGLNDNYSLLLYNGTLKMTLEAARAASAAEAAKEAEEAKPVQTAKAAAPKAKKS